MRIRKFKSHYVARLEKGDEVIACLTAAAGRKPLRSAFFFGLGVARDPVLGFFNAPKKKYIKKAFRGEYEFTSFSGNIARKGREIAIHCHVTITDDRFNAYGGHLFQATVPATMEIILMPVAPLLKRRLDRATGLHLLDIQ